MATLDIVLLTLLVVVEFVTLAYLDNYVTRLSSNEPARKTASRFTNFYAVAAALAIIARFAAWRYYGDVPTPGFALLTLVVMLPLSGIIAFLVRDMAKDVLKADGAIYDRRH